MLPTLLKALLRPLLILLSKSTLLFSKVITSLSIFSFKTSKELSILFLLSFKSFSKESLVSLNILEYVATLLSLFSFTKRVRSLVYTFFTKS